ncbi:MAG TPA: hypothetical protein PLX15_00430 [Candidatus Woesearchaeota archaeon]|nr:hypothetical protein [Candidatus Woesearchaeota archaeon]
MSSAPSSGSDFYNFLLKYVEIPASASHDIWYRGLEEQQKHPESYAFRGDIPTGKTIELVSLGGKPLEEVLSNSGNGLTNGARKYTFNGSELYVLVGDLSEESKKELGIPDTAREKDKVFNSNFKKYEDLPEITKMSNELAALSVPKSISSYLAGVNGKVNYSERDVLNLLESAFNDLSGPEMMHFLHGNHLAWAALEYVKGNGNINGDISTEFHKQNTEDFYLKDLGTILPSLFFALASLGKDPMDYYNKLDVEIWGAKDVAEYMRQYMPKK